MENRSGFAVDLESGRMIAYVKTNELGLHSLTTWEGSHLAWLRVTGRSRGFYGVKLVHFRTVEPVAGFHWYGKGQGSNMMLRLKKGKAA